MLTRYQRTIGMFFSAADALIVVAAWLLAYWHRFFYWPWAVTKELPPFDTYAALSPLVGILWIAVFSWMRVYPSYPLMGRMRELGLLLKAHFVALLLFIAVTYFSDDYKFSRLVMIWFGSLSAIGLTAFRLGLRSMLRAVRARGHNLRRLLAVGDGPLLSTVLQKLDRCPELGLSVSGVLVSEGSDATWFEGKPVLGSFGDLSTVLARTRVDEVLVALSPPHHGVLEQILEQLKDETVDLRVVPDVHRHVALGCSVEDFGGLPVVRLNDSPMVGIGAIAKRATDVLGAATGLLLLSPLLAAIALIVKLSSKGPVLFAQERMGLDGQTFAMFKFRSMRVDAEASSGAVWAKPGDDRCTPIGRFLRKTSLDELPQLWNVVRGDMSLVGPRPERPVFVQRFRSEIPYYMLRHKVKAGITGWAQVNGWRGNTSLTSRIECDLFYIKHWSYLLDLKILTLTVFKGFIHRNAY